jgi:hypothetical protein
MPVKMAVEVPKFQVVSCYEVVKALNGFDFSSTNGRIAMWLCVGKRRKLNNKGFST